MGLFDPWVMGQQFGGLLGGQAPEGFTQKDLEALLRGYGTQADAPQIPMDPSGSTPFDTAQPNPYGNPSGLMPTQTATISTDAPQPPQANGSWIRPGSLLDKFVNSAGAGVGGANAAPITAPNAPFAMGSGAEPSAVWGGPAPQMANVPMPLPRPPGLGQPQTAAQPPGQPLSILPQDVNRMPSVGGAPQPPMPPTAANAMAQEAQAGPGFGDRMLAGANNFSDPSAGLIARIANSIQGFSTGQRLDAAGQSKLQETGTDPFTGQKNFAWANPRMQSLTPATMSGQQTNLTSPGMGQFAEAIRSGVSGQKLMEYAPPEIKNRLQAMLEGREAPPSQAGLRNPQVQALLNAAHAIDPTFDETSWGKRFALIKNYQAGGKQFQEVQAINTVSGHLENLMKNADALQNTSIPIVNGVMNWVRQNAGDPRIDRLNTTIQAVTTELSKAYKAGHVSDADVRAWRENINSAKSPDQFKAVIGELNDLLSSKRNAIEQGYKDGMGPTPLPKEFSAESDKAKKAFDAVTDWSTGGKTPSATGGWSVKRMQ